METVATLIKENTPLVIIIAFIVVLYTVNFFIAMEFMKVAREKGHNGIKYFWITFLLFVVGMRLVGALPDLRAEEAAKEAAEKIEQNPEPEKRN